MNYSYTWLNETTIISTSSSSVSNTSLLNLASIETEDVGDYFCSVSNNIEPDGVDNVTLLLGGNQEKTVHFGYLEILNQYI